MSNENTFSVLFALDNSNKEIEYPDEINSLVLCIEVDGEENGIELDVEYVEQLDTNEVEIEVLMQKGKLFNLYSIIKKPSSVVVGTMNGEFRLEPSKLSVKKLIELSEDGDIQYCTGTLAKDLTRI